MKNLENENKMLKDENTDIKTTSIDQINRFDKVIQKF